MCISCVVIEYLKRPFCLISYRLESFIIVYIYINICMCIYGYYKFTLQCIIHIYYIIYLYKVNCIVKRSNWIYIIFTILVPSCFLFTSTFIYTKNFNQTLKVIKQIHVACQWTKTCTKRMAMLQSWYLIFFRGKTALSPSIISIIIF